MTACTRSRRSSFARMRPTASRRSLGWFGVPILASELPDNIADLTRFLPSNAGNALLSGYTEAMPGAGAVAACTWQEERVHVRAAHSGLRSPAAGPRCF